MFSGSIWMFSCRSRASSSTRPYDTRVADSFTLRRIVRIYAAAALLLAVGTLGFKLILHESWLDSFYRTVVTSTLNGLDSPPQGTCGRLWTIVVVLGGVTIFAYV